MIARTSLKLVAAALAAGALLASAYAAQPVELKHDIQASGPAITFADLFVDAGAAGALAVAPAPGVGQHSTLNVGLVSAAANAQGLSWTPPDGMNQITVSRRSEAGARREYAALATQNVAQVSRGPASDAVIRRGDLVTLVFVAPGLQLTTRGKALSDAGMGDPVRIVNLQSNRVVDATVTGPGSASASPASF